MNWYKKAQKQYYYYKSCVDFDEGMELQEMINRSKEITWKEFNEHVSDDQIRNAIGDIYDKTNFKIQDDYAVSFHKSFLSGISCYYLDHSAIEYIFLPGNAII